jgi:hypothetical protein
MDGPPFLGGFEGVNRHPLLAEFADVLAGHAKLAGEVGGGHGLAFLAVIETGPAVLLRLGDLGLLRLGMSTAGNQRANRRFLAPIFSECQATGAPLSKEIPLSVAGSALLGRLLRLARPPY